MPRAEAVVRPKPSVAPEPAAAPGISSALLPARLVEFIDAMTSGAPAMAAEDLSKDDVLFLEGLIRRLERAQMEVAMIPDVTLRLTDMLRHGNVPVTQYVTLINQDASLSIEVLKAANSAFYAGSARTNSLHEAVMRIGLTRLQAILMLSLMKTRVLKAGTLRAHAELLIDLSMPMASVAGAAAKWTASPVDLCFMRGMLLHVEHLRVLGTIGDTSREHRAVITPSNGAVLLAIERAGADVRWALAHGWGLEDILIPYESDGDRVNYAALRRALICRWLRQPLPAIDGIEDGQLQKLMNHVAPRVKEPQRDEPARESLSA